jgi:hypothetical protein
MCGAHNTSDRITTQIFHAPLSETKILAKRGKTKRQKTNQSKSQIQKNHASLCCSFCPLDLGLVGAADEKELFAAFEDGGEQPAAVGKARDGGGRAMRQIQLAARARHVIAARRRRRHLRAALAAKVPRRSALVTAPTRHLSRLRRCRQTNNTTQTNVSSIRTYTTQHKPMFPLSLSLRTHTTQHKPMFPQFEHTQHNTNQCFLSLSLRTHNTFRMQQQVFLLFFKQHS